MQLFRLSIAVCGIMCLVTAQADSQTNSVDNYTEQLNIDVRAISANMDRFNESVYVAKTMSLPHNNVFPHLAKIYALAKVRENPFYPSGKLRDELTYMKANVEKFMAIAESTDNFSLLDERARQLKDSMYGMAENAIPGVGFFNHLTDFVVAGFEEWQAGDAQHHALDFRADILKSHRELREETTREWRSAVPKSQTLQEIDHIFVAPDVGAQATEPGYTILARDPDFARTQQMDRIFKQIETNGGLGLTDADLSDIRQAITDAMEGYNKNLDTMMSLSRARQDAIDGVPPHIETLQDRIKFYQNQRKEAQTNKDLAARVDNYQRINQSAQGYAAFIGLFNADAGRALGATANASMKIAEAVDKFASVDLTSFGAVLLTGNIFGAVSSLIGALFGGPDVNQLILEQVQKLRQQVAELRKEMHSRFDHVDRMLNVIYDQMLTSFDTVIQNQQYTHEELTDIQNQIMDLARDIGRMDRKFSQLIGDLANRDISLKASECTDLVNRGGIITPSEITGCLQFFAHCADDAARDSIATGHTPDFASYGLSDPAFLDSIGSEISSHGIGIAAVSAVIKLTGTDLPQLASPGQWLACSGQYINLAKRWQNYYKFGSNQELERVRKNGQTLQNSLTRYADLGSKDHVYGTLIEQMLKPALEELNSAIQKERAQFERLEIAGYDLVAGTSQNPHSSNRSHPIISISEIRPCRSHGNGFDQVNLSALGGSADAIDAFLDKHVVFAHNLAGGGTKVCWDNFSFGHNHHVWRGAVCHGDMLHRAHPRVQIVGTWNGVRIFDRSKTGPRAYQWGLRAYNQFECHSHDDGNICPLHFCFATGEPGFGGNEAGWDALRQQWPEMAADFFQTAEYTNNEQVAAGVLETKKYVDDRFMQARMKFNQMLVRSFNGEGMPAVYAALRRVEAAKEVLRSFLAIGSAWHWQRSDELRYLFTGINGLPDRHVLTHHVTREDAATSAAIFDPSFFRSFVETRLAVFNSITSIVSEQQNTDLQTSLGFLPINLYLHQLSGLKDGFLRFRPKITIDAARAILSEEVKAI